MKKPERLRLTLILIVLALLTVVCSIGGDNSGEESPMTAIISQLSGKVEVLKPSVGEFKPAELNTDLEINDQVLTGDDGRVKIDLSDGTIIRLSPLSNFVLKQVERNDQGTLVTRLQLNIGRLWIVLNGGELNVDTPSGVASVRGSYLHVWVDPLKEFTNITCLEGFCSLENNGTTVNLIAGKTAMIRGPKSTPEVGHMSHADVAEWLDAHPDSTQVVVPLTETVAAGADQPLPQAQTNTPTPTATQGPSATPTVTYTITSTLLAADCGPPSGWVLHTVRTGETLESLSALYRVSVADLQKANCRGTMTFIVPGEKLYVPNVATSTPTFTPTPTLTPTQTPLVTGTTTGGGGGATITPTNSPTILSGPVGPDNETISDVSLCPKPYKIQVVDPDGIAEVKMIYTFDGSLPMRDSAVSAGRYVLLPLISGNTYGISGKVIDTTGQTTPVTIRFRFEAMDKLGNLTYYPTSTAYTLTDQVNCSSAASFSNEAGPSGTTITNAANCALTFQIDATDPDGIADAKLLYNVNGVTPTWSTSVAAGDYFTLSKSGSTYSTTKVIDSSVGTSDVIKYVYAIKDGLGNIYLYPETGDFVYTDTVNCGETVWSNVISPDTLTLVSNGQCTQNYSVDVTDANGVSKVEVFYTISDGIIANANGKFALPLSAGSTYAIAKLIDSTTFTPTYTISFEFKATDNLGHVTSLFTGSFDSAVACP
jgi:hypothetical protein